MELYRETLMRGISADQTFPVVKCLPNGDNLRGTVQVPAFWQQVFATAAAHRPELRWELRAHAKGEEADVRLGNTHSTELAPAKNA